MRKQTNLGWTLLGLTYLALRARGGVAISLMTGIVGLLPLIAELSKLIDTENAAKASRPSRGRMTHAEALEVLGVPSAATQEDILTAHRNLMRKVHPDLGGTSYLASKINQARDTLIIS